MTIKELYDLYTSNLVETDRQIILCDFETQDGYQVNNSLQFQEVIRDIKATDAYIMRFEYDDKLTFYEYLVMNKTDPIVAVMHHPELTNAYWKDMPDKILDSFDIDGMIYRYLMVTYRRGISDYVIEFPEAIDEQILNYTKSLMPSGFQSVPGNVISVLFTNSDRFLKLGQVDIVPYNIDKLFLDWDAKNKNIVNTSQKFWKEIKGILNVKK